MKVFSIRIWGTVGNDPYCGSQHLTVWSTPIVRIIKGVFMGLRGWLGQYLIGIGEMGRYMEAERMDRVGVISDH